MTLHPYKAWRIFATESLLVIVAGILLLVVINVAAALLDMPISVYLVLSVIVVLVSVAYLGILICKQVKHTANFYILDYIEKHRTFLLVITIILLTLAIVAFLARGWLRTTAVPAYANRVYKPKVIKAFNENYPAVQSALSASGLTMPSITVKSPPAACDKITDDESTLTFNDFRETVNCYQLSRIDQIDKTDEFVTNWRQKAPALHSYLNSHGYHRSDDPEYKAVSLEDLFSTKIDYSEVTVRYKKSIGSVDCYIDVYSSKYRTDYTSYGSTSTEQPTAFAYYQCGNALSLFGGYSYY